MKTWKMLSMMVMILALLSACVPSKDKPSVSSEHDNTGPGDPIPVTIFTPKLSWEGEFGSDVNEFTKHVEEKFNIQITWELAPQDAAKEKQQLSLASGDYPDAYFAVTWLDGFSKIDVQKYGKEGVFLPLNDLIEEHAPNIKKAMNNIEYLQDGITAPDGNIYALPSINECYHCSRYGKMWINTEWLDQLGLKMPATTEEFRDVLRAFKDQDPNGNDLQDEIPLSGETSEVGNSPTIFLMNAFIHNNGNDFINIDNGKLNLAAMQPEWKEGLKYIHSLYEEGFIDTGAFTQNMEALKQLGTREGDAILGASAATHLAVFMDLVHEKSNAYDVVPPLKGPTGVQLTTANYGAVDVLTFAITEKATGAKAEALIKLADYLYSEEGTMFATKGKEGVSWRKGEPTDIDLTGKQAKYAMIPADPDKKEEKDKTYYAWGERGPIMLTREFRDAMAAPEDQFSPEGYERRLFNATVKYDGYEPQDIFIAKAAWIDPVDAEEVSLLQINMNKYINENTVQFITGAKDIEREWDSYLNGFDKLNVKRYLEIYQSAYAQ